MSDNRSRVGFSHRISKIYSGLTVYLLTKQNLTDDKVRKTRTGPRTLNDDDRYDVAPIRKCRLWCQMAVAAAQDQPILGPDDLGANGETCRFEAVANHRCMRRPVPDVGHVAGGHVHPTDPDNHRGQAGKIRRPHSIFGAVVGFVINYEINLAVSHYLTGNITKVDKKMKRQPETTLELAGYRGRSLLKVLK